MRDRPNIVLIVADDMGYGDFGCFNYGVSKTPAIDHLAAESVCLTQHYSASPVCAPARASLLTGRYPHRTGVIDTLETRGLDRLALRERTIADRLRQAGYVTGLIGKWHNGAYDHRYHPNRRGFDEFAGFCGGWQPYWKWQLDRNGALSRGDGRYLTDVFTEEALDFVRRHRSEPFFLYLAYNAPHFPFEAPDDDLARFDDSDNFTAAVRRIYAMIRRMDFGIGRVLEQLDRSGIAENTIVLFTSDNGPQFGGTGEMCSDRFNCGFAGSKLLVYEGGIRLPMVLRWPAGFEGRRQLHELAHLTDWLPTLVSLTGGQVPKDLHLDGVNLGPLLRGEPGRVNPTRFWQWNRYTPVGECNAAMRDGNWKLVRPAISELMTVSGEDLALDVDAKYHPQDHSGIVTTPRRQWRPYSVPSPQLFNLGSDPLERNNLAEQYPDRVTRMTNQLAAWFEEVELERRTIDD
jgi:arylsulfatase A-like enzyme